MTIAEKQTHENIAKIARSLDKVANNLEELTRLFHEGDAKIRKI